MNELVVSKTDSGLRIALLHDKKIVELHHEKLTEAFSVGDLFLGKVRKIVTGLNATFVDVGHPRDAFLHYFDLGPQVRSLLKYTKIARNSRGRQADIEKVRPLPDINKHGKMSEVLRANQDILVQIVKEPISTKGPRLSSEISLPGQYVVLVPFSKAVSVSKKVRTQEERRRLKVLAESLCPQNFGIIVRTAAEGKDAQTLANDISGIVDKWNKMSKALSGVRAPAKVLSENNRATSILRDMLHQGFDTIYVDDAQAHSEIKSYLEQNKQENLLKGLKHYKGKTPLYQYLGIEKQIKASFGKVASMSNGAYLVIEHTEAMHVIDVNSGSKNLSDKTLEETALRTNMEAATEIARQLRLRDMGGIIVVDFIDLKKSENRRILNDHFRKVMKDDRAKHSILPISKFGLVQITRQRVRPQIDIQTTEVCPSCNGTGKMQPSILIADEISNNIEFLVRQNKEKKLTIRVNPYVESYLKKGFFKSHQITWFHTYWIWIKVVGDSSLGFTEVKYFNSNDEEIKL